MGSDDEVAEHVERVAETGWTVVEDAIEPDLLDSIERALARLEDELAVVPSDNAFEGRQTVRIYNLLARDRVFERVPVHPRVLPVIEGVIGTGCLVSSLSSIAIGPGEAAQPLHTDDQLIPLPRPHPPVICNSMWAIGDFTEANGATRFVEGSHLHPDVPDPFGETPTTAAVMRRGSVLVWPGSLWHGGGANTTNLRRTGLAMNYCAGWVRQQENQQLGIPLEIARRFSPELRDLCGYGVYQSLIGHIDKASPSRVVLGPAPDEVAGDGTAPMAWELLG